MKKIIAVLLLIILAFSLCSCGKRRVLLPSDPTAGQGEKDDSPLFSTFKDDNDAPPTWVSAGTQIGSDEDKETDGIVTGDSESGSSDKKVQTRRPTLEVIDGDQSVVDDFWDYWDKVTDPDNRDGEMPVIISPGDKPEDKPGEGSGDDSGSEGQSGTQEKPADGGSQVISEEDMNADVIYWSDIGQREIAPYFKTAKYTQVAGFDNPVSTLNRHDDYVSIIRVSSDICTEKALCGWYFNFCETNAGCRDNFIYYSDRASASGNSLGCWAAAGKIMKNVEIIFDNINKTYTVKTTPETVVYDAVWSDTGAYISKNS